jgi:hypothetical protein
VNSQNDEFIHIRDGYRVTIWDNVMIASYISITSLTHSLYKVVKRKKFIFWIGTYAILGSISKPFLSRNRYDG